MTHLGTYLWGCATLVAKQERNGQRQRFDELFLFLFFCRPFKGWHSQEMQLNIENEQD